LKSSGPAVHAWHCLAPLWRFVRAATFAVVAVAPCTTSSAVIRCQRIAAGEAVHSWSCCRHPKPKLAFNHRCRLLCISFWCGRDLFRWDHGRSRVLGGHFWTWISFGLNYFEECIHLYIRF
jgi:hypothetical protein